MQKRPSRAASQDQDRENAIRRSLQRRIEWKRRRLRCVRLCQSTPEPERVLPESDLYFECGYVYLMEKLTLTRTGFSARWTCLPNCPYKIGATNRAMKVRSKELANVKQRLMLREKYATVVPFPLEKALHRHFDQYRVRRKGERQPGKRKNQKGELFRLPREHVEEFKVTVAEVERWVLRAEEARLELVIMRMEAAL